MGGARRKAGNRARMVKMWSWEIRSSLVGCRKNQCPSSCASTASTSSGLLSAMRVSKMTMCFAYSARFSQIVSNRELISEATSLRTQGKPKKYALLCELLFDPSISYRCFNGNLSFVARFSIRVRSSPSLRGESLLNSGWMTVGYMTTIESWNINLQAKQVDQSKIIP